MRLIETEKYVEKNYILVDRIACVRVVQGGEAQGMVSPFYQSWHVSGLCGARGA